MKEKGVDFVVTCMDINESFMLAKEMQKQGLERCSSCRTATTRTSSPSNADLLEGSIVVPQFVAFEQEPQIPEIKKYLA